MDRSLFRQLWSVHESIQEIKQSHDKLSETNSECSSIAYSGDGQLDPIQDYKEPVYENEVFHSRIYENYNALSRMSNQVKSEEEDIYEPVYLRPHSQGKRSERPTSRSSKVKTGVYSTSSKPRASYESSI